MKYLKPTPLKGYGLMVLITVLMILLTGSYFYYYILVLEIITCLMMYLFVSRNSKMILQYLSVGEEEVEVGDLVKIDVKSNNTSIFPVVHAKVQCKIKNNHNQMVFPSENVFFNPFQIVNIRERFKIKTRGIFNTGLITTEYSDPLRIFRRKQEIVRDIRLVVYPKVYELDYFYMPNTGYLGTRTVANSGHEDFSSLKKVRKYEQGDSFKRIHWKLSSKRGEMFVKEYESTSSTKMTLFLDAFNEHYMNDEERYLEDKAVEVAAAITKYALRLNSDVSMIFHGDRLVQVDSRDLSTYPTVLKELVAFTATGHSSMSELLNQEAKRLDQGSFIVLITPKITKALVSTLIGLKRRSFEISLVLVGNEEEETKDMLQGLGVHVYIMGVEDDIKEKLEAFA